jgi:hypothetical protein
MPNRNTGSMTDKPDRKRWAKFVAYALLAIAAILLAAFTFWACRMVAVWVSIGGSVPIARQMASSLGWDGVAFVAMTIGVASVMRLRSHQLADLWA